MPAPTPSDGSPVRSSHLRHFGRILLAVFLFAWIAFIGIAAFQWIREAPSAARLGLSLAFLAGPVWVFVRRLRNLRKRSSTYLPASVALVVSSAGFLAWLAQDDVVWRHAEAPAALRNDFPEAAATHELTLRYSKTAPGSLLSTLPESKLVFPSSEGGPENDTKWKAFLAANASELDALWDTLGPLRGWIDELAAAPAIGDFAKGPESPVMDFRSLRLVSHVCCARALQLAADGRRDEAAEIVLPILIASRKIQPHGASLVRRMIGIVIQRLAQNTIARVLASGDFTPETRAHLIAALAPDPDIAGQARLLIWCEYAPLCSLLFGIDAPNATTIFHLPGSENPLLRALARAAFVVSLNPRLTANRYGDHLAAMGDAAARRNLSVLKTESESFARRLSPFVPGKNQGGRMFLAMALPSYQKVTENFWKAEDERAALLARLQPAP